MSSWLFMSGVQERGTLFKTVIAWDPDLYMPSL